MHLIIPYHEGRPSITLQLQTKHGQWKFFTALLDSGADFSIFPISYAYLLDIDLRRLPKEKVESADGDFFHVYKTSIPGRFGKRNFHLPIGFSNKPNITPLLGRAGFFEIFKIEFNERRKFVILRSY